MRLAEASSSAEAAERMFLHRCYEVTSMVEAGKQLGLEKRAEYRRDGAFATKLCVRSVDILFEGSGGNALYLKMLCSGILEMYTRLPGTLRSLGMYRPPYMDRFISVCHLKVIYRKFGLSNVAINRRSSSFLFSWIQLFRFHGFFKR